MTDDRAESPLACPRCGCRDLRPAGDADVVWTRKHRTCIIRGRRACRHCGYILQTIERYTRLPQKGH